MGKCPLFFVEIWVAIDAEEEQFVKITQLKS
jgi:hypothetical protein